MFYFRLNREPLWPFLLGGVDVGCTSYVLASGSVEEKVGFICRRTGRCFGVLCFVAVKGLTG
jgi:hypothetical protein